MPDSTITGTHPTLSALRGALMVMEAADKAGLPVPINVHTSSCGAVEYGQPTRVSFVLGSLDEVTAWATYLDRPVDHVRHDGAIQHSAEGRVFDQRVEAWFIEKSVEAAS